MNTARNSYQEQTTNGCFKHIAANKKALIRNQNAITNYDLLVLFPATVHLSVNARNLFISEHLIIRPLQKNLWVVLGSGRAPMV